MFAIIFHIFGVMAALTFSFTLLTVLTGGKLHPRTGELMMINIPLLIVYAIWLL
jgi:hypothetical protein